MGARIRTKKELKKLFTNLKRKGISDDMMSTAIDALWRNKVTTRSSGFYWAGGVDSVITFTNLTRTFSISPYDPEIEDWAPRFGFYFNGVEICYVRKWSEETIEIPDEEGLYFIYYDTGETSLLQDLSYIKNPTDAELKKIYETKTLISAIYWDYDNQQALTFGDDRHGSEVNPQQHYINHQTLHGLRQAGGLSVSGMLISEDGSLAAHAQFTVSAGSFWHDDFVITVDEVAGGTSALPVLYFSGSSNYPRFTTLTGFQVAIAGTGRLAYNANSESITECTEGYHVAYHVFATNDKLSGQQIISVMGQAEYDKLATAFAEAKNEVNNIYALAPQQGLCYLGSVFLQTSDNYTNAVKGRLVGFNGDEVHAPLSIADDSTDFLSVNEDQELSFIADASKISVDTTNFSGILSSEQDTIQKCLDVLDDHTHDDRYYLQSEIDILLSDLDNAMVKTVNSISPTLGNINIGLSNLSDYSTTNGLTAGSFIFNNGNGFSSSGDNTSIHVALNLIPKTDDTYNLGYTSTSYRWRNLYLSGCVYSSVAPTIGNHLTNKTYVDGLPVSTFTNDVGYITSQFTPTSLLSDYGFTDNSTNWNAAYSWGDHAGLYLTSYTETDPIFTASQAYNITFDDIINLANLSGTNSGDQQSSDFDHNQLTNYDIAQHRIINDSGTSTTELWSASKISTAISEISGGSTDYINAASFSSGTLSLSGVGSASASVSLDGRYGQLSSSNTWSSAQIFGSLSTNRTKITDGVIQITSSTPYISFTPTSGSGATIQSSGSNLYAISDLVNIGDANPTSTGENAIRVTTTDLYLYNLDNTSTSYVTYYDPSTHKLTYGASPSSGSSLFTDSVTYGYVLANNNRAIYSGDNGSAIFISDNAGAIDGVGYVGIDYDGVIYNLLKLDAFNEQVTIDAATYLTSNVGIGTNPNTEGGSSSYKVYVNNSENPHGLIVYNSKATASSVNISAVTGVVTSSQTSSVGVLGKASATSGTVYGGRFEADNSPDGIAAYFYGGKSAFVAVLNDAPASSGATGSYGEVRFTSNYIYVCTSSNTWKRAALTTW
jgi:hypothetical protein